jgi:hypothetical protein
MKRAILNAVLFGTLVFSLTSCLVRNDLFDVQYNSVSQQNPEFEQFVGIEIDTVDGLITREHPATPLSDGFYIVLNSQPTLLVQLGTI